MLRRETPQLRDLLSKSEELYPKFGAKLNQTTGVWRFPSGATLWFTHCEHETDVQRFDGHEFHFVGADELTHFTERQITAICARIRGTDPGLPRIFRATTNPGGPGAPWVFKRFGAWLDPKHPRPSRPGMLRWYVGEREVPRGTPDALSRTFIPARLSDNPRLSPEYRARLLQLDPVRRAQLLEGDWLKRAAPKDLWDRDVIGHRDYPPLANEIRAVVRCWDFAASEKRGADWIVGMRASVTTGGLITLEHMVRFQGAPAKVRATFKKTAAQDLLDDPRTVQWIPQDPGQAGVDQVHSYQVENPGVHIRARRPSGDKLVRFGPASGRAFHGGLVVVRGPWNEALHDELEDAPVGEHDDVMDAVSDCVAVLTGAVPAEFTDETAAAAAQATPTRDAERDAYSAFMQLPDDDYADE